LADFGKSSPQARCSTESETAKAADFPKDEDNDMEMETMTKQASHSASDSDSFSVIVSATARSPGSLGEGTLIKKSTKI